MKQGSQMRMRLFNGKRLVAKLRSGDYAHAGEEAAIDQMFAGVSADKERKILDIGCGQGGTAAYIQEKGFGRVTGVDKELKSIEYAKEHYPQVSFKCSDVADVHRVFDEKFSLICAFNSFYAFPDQLAALIALREVAADGADLLIFDYVDYADCTRGDDEDVSKIFLPIRHETILDMLAQTGWSSVEIINLDEEYTEWYRQFIKNLIYKKDEIITEFGEEAFNYAKETYEKLYQSLNEGRMGGGIIKAKALAPSLKISMQQKTCLKS